MSITLDYCLLTTANGCFFVLDPHFCFLSLPLKLFWLPEVLVSLRVLTGNFDGFGVDFRRVFSLFKGGLELELAPSLPLRELVLVSVWEKREWRHIKNFRLWLKAEWVGLTGWLLTDELVVSRSLLLSSWESMSSKGMKELPSSVVSATFGIQIWHKNHQLSSTYLFNHLQISGLSLAQAQSRTPAVEEESVQLLLHSWTPPKDQSMVVCELGHLDSGTGDAEVSHLHCCCCKRCYFLCW